MPASLDSGAIGFAEADSVGPGDGDANEVAKDAAQNLVEDNEGDVRRQKAPRTVDKGVLKAAREAVEVAWERLDVHELAAQSQAASVGKPKKIIESNIVNLFVAWELDKQSGVLLCGQHVSQMSVPDVLEAWVRAMALSSFDSSGLRTSTARAEHLLQLPLHKLPSSRVGSCRPHSRGPHLHSVCVSMSMLSTLLHTSPRPRSAHLSCPSTCMRQQTSLGMARTLDRCLCAHLSCVVER